MRAAMIVAARDAGSTGSSRPLRMKLLALSVDVRELGHAVSTERRVSPRDLDVGIDGKLDCEGFERLRRVREDEDGIWGSGGIAGRDPIEPDLRDRSYGR